PSLSSGRAAASLEWCPVTDVDARDLLQVTGVVGVILRQAFDGSRIEVRRTTAKLIERLDRASLDLGPDGARNDPLYGRFQPSGRRKSRARPGEKRIVVPYGHILVAVSR